MIDKRYYPYAPQVWPTLKPGSLVAVRTTDGDEETGEVVEATKDRIKLKVKGRLHTYLFSNLASIMWPPEDKAEKA